MGLREAGVEHDSAIAQRGVKIGSEGRQNGPGAVARQEMG